MKEYDFLIVDKMWTKFGNPQKDQSLVKARSNKIITRTAPRLYFSTTYANYYR